MGTSSGSGSSGIDFLVAASSGLGSTLTYQNLQKSRVPINSILGFIITTYKKIGFGRLR